LHSAPAKVAPPADCPPAAEAPFPDGAETPAPLFQPVSRVEGRVEGLSFLERSLLFAELSKAAYLCRTEAGRVGLEIGLPETRFYDRDGAQAYMFGNDTDAVIVCRGTEPNQWNDIKADLDAKTALVDTGGRVHRGFQREVDDLWPRLEQALVSNTRTLWFAGHSLGGAMTAICAGRCYLSHIDSNPRAVFTFGSPRVGDSRFINRVKMEYYRWVNNNDIVTRVPPRWLGYAHGGIEVYLDRRGRLSPVTGLWRQRDRFRGFFRSLAVWKFDHLNDHLMTEYLRAIHGAVKLEQTGAPPRQMVKTLERVEAKVRKLGLVPPAMPPEVALAAND
jgi:triacylglycerol lipase